MRSHFIPHTEINLRSSFHEFEIIPMGIVMVNSVCLLDWAMGIQMFGQTLFWVGLELEGIRGAGGSRVIPGDLGLTRLQWTVRRKIGGRPLASSYLFCRY